jgi:PhnB protein
MAKAKKGVPDGYGTVTLVLTLDEARKGIDWYKQALGAEELSVNLGPDGKIAHGEIRVGNSIIMLNDPMMGGKGPKALGGSPASMWVYVEDCDALFRRAVAAGGTVQMPMDDQFWGDRCGGFADPFGYTWMIATRKEDLTKQELEQRQVEFFSKMAAGGDGGGPGPK